MKYYLIQMVPYENNIVDVFDTLEELKKYKYKEYDYYVIKGEEIEIE